MRKFTTSRQAQRPVFLILAGALMFSTEGLKADIVELSYGNTNGQKSVKGFVLQGSRNMKKLGKRRSTTSSVILPPLSLETLSQKAPEVPVPQAPKPRFGYGSDYQPEGRPQEKPAPQAPQTSSRPTPVDASSAIRFLPVKRNRSYYPRVPYYGYSSTPYFYRPGSPAQRYYLNSPGCYSNAAYGSTPVNVYHGGNLTFSSWSPVFGHRYYR